MSEAQARTLRGRHWAAVLQAGVLQAAPPSLERSELVIPGRDRHWLLVPVAVAGWRVRSELQLMLMPMLHLHLEVGWTQDWSLERLHFGCWELELVALAAA